MALEILASRRFAEWLQQIGGSLAFTTYQAGKLFFVGVHEGRLSLFERTFNRCMGLCAHDGTLWLSTLYQLWRFENALAPGQLHEGYDRLFIPRLAYTTGDIDIHDVHVASDGEPIFVNTLFGCLARPSPTHSFKPIWKPPWLTAVVPEDRCHLNGLALEHGEPAYVTAVSRSDVADGWRDRRASGGVVVHVPTGDVVVDGLSMPHSPRCHRGELWLLEAGTGFIGRVDRNTGAFERVAFLPGYLRGLAIHGGFAVVGTSKSRGDQAFRGLALTDNLADRDAEPRCGVHVIDLASGVVEHWLRIEGVVEELYDVVVLPGVRRPMALGLKTDEIRRMITVGPTEKL
jgi:uncharacterized protein (TIGR03032 family)